MNEKILEFLVDTIEELQKENARLTEENMVLRADKKMLETNIKDGVLAGKPVAKLLKICTWLDEQNIDFKNNKLFITYEPKYAMIHPRITLEV